MTIKEILFQESLPDSQSGALEEYAISYMKDDFEKGFGGVLDYYDYLGKPIVYSKRDVAYYTVDNDGMVVEYIDSVIGRDDLEPLSLEEFNARFYDKGSIAETKFKNKAEIENELEMMLYTERLNKWFNELLESTGYTQEEKEKIKKAHSLAREGHMGQFRKEGTKYYSHPVFAAIKGIQMGLSAEDIIVLLLHDIIEDTEMSEETIKKEFGENVLSKVLALSKKSNGEKIVTEEQYYDRLSKDEELAILKGIDRLTNIYSLSFLDKIQQESYIIETIEKILPIVSNYSQDLTNRILRLIHYVQTETPNFTIRLRVDDLKKADEIRKSI